MKILVFDNYDSFTYNLVHYLQIAAPDAEIEIHRNNQITLEAIDVFDKILLSPGSGVPQQAGLLLDVITTYSATKNILGICLGQQAIAEAFGGTLINLNEVYHGVATPVEVVSDDYLFTNIPRHFKAGRYHSWVADKQTLPDCIEITCVDEQGNIMGLRHKSFDVRGVQFHPESILTEYGLQLLKNWLRS